MKRNHSLLVFILIFSCLSVQLDAKKVDEKLALSFNSNVELLGFAYFLGFEGQDIETATLELGDQNVPKKEWHAFGYSFYKKYQSHLSNEDLQAAFAVADHLWLDYLINFLLQVEPFPNAVLPEDMHPERYLSFSPAKDPAEAKINANVVTFT